jgi:hypothetical protein
MEILYKQKGFVLGILCTKVLGKMGIVCCELVGGTVGLRLLLLLSSEGGGDDSLQLSLQQQLFELRQQQSWK